MKLTKKNRQTGGAVTLSPDEADIFNRIKNIYSMPEGKQRKKYTDEIDKDIKNKLFLNDKVIIQVNNSETKEQSLSDLSGNSLNKDSELLPYDYYSTNEYYTSVFKSVIKTFENIVLENDDNDNVIYVSIGKVFSKFICSKNNFNERFAKYILDINKVRVYNKLILLQKLNYTINEVINYIGKCDTGIFSRNTPACVKDFFGKLSSDISNKFNSVFEKSFALDKGNNSTTGKNSTIATCDPDTDNSIKNDIASKILSTNVIRSQLISFIEMYKENIVSYKEASNKKKQNPTIWVRNPAFLAATTVFVNATLALNNVSADLQSNKEFINSSNEFIKQTLHHPPMASAMIASTFIGMVVPLGGLAFWGVVTVLKRVLFTNREWYKLLENSNEINLSFIEYINYWLNKDKAKPGVIRQIGKEVNDATFGVTYSQTTPDMEKCTLSGDAGKYFSNFKNAKKLIDNYTLTANGTFKNENLCLYSVNAYNIICGSLPQEQLDEPVEPGLDTSNKVDITQSELLKNEEKQRKKDETEKAEREREERVAAEKTAAAEIQSKFDEIKAKYTKELNGNEKLSDTYIQQHLDIIKDDIQDLQNLDKTCDIIPVNDMGFSVIKSIINTIIKVSSFSGIKKSACTKKVLDVDTQTNTAPVTAIATTSTTAPVTTTSTAVPVTNTSTAVPVTNTSSATTNSGSNDEDSMTEFEKRRAFEYGRAGGRKSRKMRKRKGKTQNKRSKKRKTIRRR